MCCAKIDQQISLVFDTLRGWRCPQAIVFVNRIALDCDNALVARSPPPSTPQQKTDFLFLLVVPGTFPIDAG